MSTPALVVRTPRMGYVEAWDTQRRLADQVRVGDLPTVIWLLEHDPVYTYGRHGTRQDLFIEDAALAGLGATCVATDRGGQMTWHGPGQTTGYVITNLRGGRGVRHFVEVLVDAMTDATGLAGADADHTRMGTYMDGRKVGSVGIRVTEGVTMHGIGLNRDADLEWFRIMSACGAPDVSSTTIAAEAGDPARLRVEAAFVAALADRLDLQPTEGPLPV